MTENHKSLKSKIVTAVLIIVGVLCLALFLSCTVFRKNKDRPAFVFGHAYLYVETGSMESTIPARSYILVKKTGKTVPKIGDVIVFICQDPTLPVYGKMVTHRVVDITPGGEYVTKGDNPLSSIDKTAVKSEDVVAFYVRSSKILTFFGRLFSSKAGLFIIIGMFAFAVVFVYLSDIIKSMTEEKSAEEEKEAAFRARIEEEVRRLEKEGALSKPDGDSVGNPDGETPEDFSAPEKEREIADFTKPQENKSAQSEAAAQDKKPAQAVRKTAENKNRNAK